MPQEPVIIPLSKVKLVKLLSFAVVLTALSAWLLFYNQNLNKIYTYVAGTAGFLFFGMCTVFYILKLRDNKPGLVIDPKGVTDNASGVSAGFIPWGDITHIYTTEVMNQEFVMIGVANPDDYINRQKNTLKRKAMAYNHRNYSSPVTISANGLKTNRHALYALLIERWEAYKTPDKKQEPVSHSDEWYADSGRKRVAFTALLRQHLPEILGKHSYTLTYDNKDKDQQDSHNWVFLLEFTGAKVIAVFNDDWRDYVEYFTVTCDGQEVFGINTDKYGTEIMAFENFRKKLLEVV